MPVTADLIARLIQAGTPPELVGEVAMALVEAAAGAAPAQGRSARPVIDESLRQAVINRDMGRCRYCGIIPLIPQCDHVLPWTRGGETTMDNLVVACKPCNSSKKDMTPKEWRQ